jgi:hypothetical protein
VRTDSKHTDIGRVALQAQPADAPTPNAALREIAARLKRLPYRDLTKFARTLGSEIIEHYDETEVLIEAILEAADKLENA